MKTIIASTLILAMRAQAALLDLTPGGFSELNPPQIFWWLVQTQNQVAGGNFFDQSNPKNFTWSPYEPLGADNFTVIRTGIQSALVGWHLQGTQYGCQFVLIEGQNGFANIYASDALQMIHDIGFIWDGAPPIGIVFYGPGPFLHLNHPMKTW
jgi:hypothetical protein